MAEQGRESLKHKTYLNAYCPFCSMGLNKKQNDGDTLNFTAKSGGREFDLILKPYLETLKAEIPTEINEIDTLDDLICPHCGASLIHHNISCGECNSPAGKIIVSTFSKLIPFYICLKINCHWHGLSKADEKKMEEKILRQKMPEQDPKLRIHNFKEVPHGLTTELALIEAGRCLQCKNPQCVSGCPVEVDIPSFIKQIGEENFDEAAKIIKEKNILPAVCGRVCPQEDQCEARCILGKKEGPVAIGNLERFAADYEREMKLVKIPAVKKGNGKKVAIVGSGPAGLTAAADLIQLGYQATIFESLHEPGGVLLYGIPEFRLPKSIIHFEIDYLLGMGCKIEVNHIIGKILTIDELLEDFDAVFLGLGAGLPLFMNIPGENLGNILSANEYLTRINLMRAYKFPQYDTPMPKGNRIAVIGGGNVAMDCARTALRCGAEEVTIVYRRSRNELPARNEEIIHAEQEGIIFRLLTNPVKFTGDERNRLTGIECISMKLGDTDESGRRKPMPVPDSNFFIGCDMAIVAVGTGPNSMIFGSAADIRRNKRGYIEVDPETMETSKEFVYAGGDIVSGSATVIQAMGAGRIAAGAIHQKLSSKN